VTEAQSLRADFEKAVARLDKAPALPKDPIVRDSAIQAWCHRRRRVLDDVTVLRNYTIDTYNEEFVDYVYSRLVETARRFRTVLIATEGP
jgi:hypothetical protein